MVNLRSDLADIIGWIKPGTRVLDLGCGDGTLLRYLMDHLDVTGYGIEIDQSNIVSCISKGINVIQLDIDEGLSDFDEESFDYVVMTQTIQTMYYPVAALNEMLRIGREGIVTFPNMAHWQARLSLALGGRMPVSRSLPNAWYDTPNIHLCTIKDFEDVCKKENIRILERNVVDSQHRDKWTIRLRPNLFGEIALYRFCRAE